MFEYYKGRHIYFIEKRYCDICLDNNIIIKNNIEYICSSCRCEKSNSFKYVVLEGWISKHTIVSTTNCSCIACFTYGKNRLLNPKDIYTDINIISNVVNKLNKENYEK